MNKIRLLSKEEVAVLLGIHPITVFRLSHKGRIPGVVRVGRLLRFSEPTLVEWMRGTQISGDEKDD